jgi:hypothetical protein
VDAKPVWLLQLLGGITLKIFVVVLAAVPKKAGNCLAIKIPAVCLRESRAEAFAQIAKESQGSVVYGLECSVFTKIIPWDLDVSSTPTDLYVVMNIAIPIEEGRPPTQANVYKVCLSPEDAEKTFMEINAKKIEVAGIACETQSSITQVRLDIV